MFVFCQCFASGCRAHFYPTKNAGGDVANEKNLIPIAERSPNEAREMGRKGGKASGKVRREKRDIKKAMETLLNAKVANPEIAENIAEMFGIKPETVTWLDGCVAGTVREAVGGNVKAMHEIRDIMGETNDEEESGVQIVIAPRGGNNED